MRVSIFTFLVKYKTYTIHAVLLSAGHTFCNSYLSIFVNYILVLDIHVTPVISELRKPNLGIQEGQLSLTSKLMIFLLFQTYFIYYNLQIAGSSKGVQNSMDIPEMSVRHQKEVPEKGRWSPQMVSTWAPAGICWSGGASQEACMTPDTEQSLESLQPLEEDMALNEVLRKLKRTNKEQETRIQDLECRNSYLEKKVEELQMTTTKQHVFVDIINKLKEKIEELIEEKYRIKLEKSDTEKTLQGVHEILVTTQNHLQEYQSEKETLQLEFKKLKGNYVSLQERYMTQCMEMDSALSKKEEEIERLQQLRGELEKATIAALDLMKRERETGGQEFLSLREEFQKCEREHLDERERLKSKLEKLVAQVQNVQFLSDSEKAKNAELQQQINEVKNENTKLQQQIARSEEQNCVPKCEIARLKDNLEDVIKSDVAKVLSQIQNL